MQIRVSKKYFIWLVLGTFPKCGHIISSQGNCKVLINVHLCEHYHYVIINLIPYNLICICNLSSHLGLKLIFVKYKIRHTIILTKMLKLKIYLLLLCQNQRTFRLAMKICKGREGTKLIKSIMSRLSSYFVCQWLQNEWNIFHCIQSILNN